MYSTGKSIFPSQGEAQPDGADRRYHAQAAETLAAPPRRTHAVPAGRFLGLGLAGLALACLLLLMLALA